MKIERSKNALRNIIFGIIMKIVQIIIPFFMRSVIIYYLGIEYLGLTSLFSSVLQVLNLAELGVGSAMVYSMYKPITEDDSSTICSLMNLYRLYYRIIGCIVLVAGLVVLPFIPRLIKSDVPPDINIYVLYLLNLSATVLSYWLFAYKNALLDAHQRQDITSKVTLFTNLVQYGLQFLVLWLTRNYYIYVMIIMLTQIFTNVLIAIFATRMYPDYKPEGKLEKEEVNRINNRIRDLFTSKIGGVVVNSADTIVISAFLGLTMLAIYQNYFLIITAVIAFVTILFNSCLAGIGNSLIVETKEKNFNDLKKFTFLISWIACICSSCFLCMFQPFMKIWMGEEKLLPFGVVICLVVYYYIYEINQLMNLYKDASGIWHEDRFRPLVTAICNLGMNIILVNYIGIYGIALSTSLSMLLVGMPWLVHNLFSTVFERKYMFHYMKYLGVYSFSTLLVCVVCLFLCNLFSIYGVLKLIINCSVCVVVSNLVFLIAFHNTQEFKECILLLDRLTKGKLRLKRIIRE